MPRQSFRHRVAVLTPSNGQFYIRRDQAKELLNAGVAIKVSKRPLRIRITDLLSIYRVLIPGGCDNFRIEFKSLHKLQRSGKPFSAHQPLTEEELEFEKAKQRRQENRNLKKAAAWSCDHCPGIVMWDMIRCGWYCIRCNRESE